LAACTSACRVSLQSILIHAASSGRDWRGRVQAVVYRRDNEATALVYAVLLMANSSAAIACALIGRGALPGSLSPILIAWTSCNEMRDLRRFRHMEPRNRILQDAVGIGDPFVLAKMLQP
jgi:hypothetical protein